MHVRAAFGNDLTSSGEDLCETKGLAICICTNGFVALSVDVQYNITASESGCDRLVVQKPCEDLDLHSGLPQRLQTDRTLRLLRAEKEEPSPIPLWRCG
eukprot:4809642-Prymnesium_polylepis.1